MDDLTIVRLCAEAVGEEHRTVYDWDGEPYNPLHDDAQAMALVKRFRINVISIKFGEAWNAKPDNSPYECNVTDPNLNRAICLAVATMQEGKNG